MMSADLELMKAMSSLYRKKAAVMKALEGGMAKTGSNDHFNYKFVTASNIKQTVGALLADHGLSLQMSGVGTESSTTEIELKNGAIKRVPILRIQFAISLCDVDTGAIEQSFWFGEAEARDDKAASKAATSALKYYLISNLMIADKTEDKRDTDRGPNKRQSQETKQDTPPQKGATGQVLAKVLPEYKPFMTDENFGKMRTDLRNRYENNALVLAHETVARAHIDKTYGGMIDLDNLRAARKDTN